MHMAKRKLHVKVFKLLLLLVWASQVQAQTLNPAADLYGSETPAICSAQGTILLLADRQSPWTTNMPSPFLRAAEAAQTMVRRFGEASVGSEDPCNVLQTSSTLIRDVEVVVIVDPVRPSELVIRAHVPALKDWAAHQLVEISRISSEMIPANRSLEDALQDELTTALRSSRALRLYLSGKERDAARMRPAPEAVGGVIRAWLSAVPVSFADPLFGSITFQPQFDDILRPKSVAPSWDPVRMFSGPGVRDVDAASCDTRVAVADIAWASYVAGFWRALTWDQPSFPTPRPGGTINLKRLYADYTDCFGFVADRFASVTDADAASDLARRLVYTHFTPTAAATDIDAIVVERVALMLQMSTLSMSRALPLPEESTASPMLFRCSGDPVLPPSVAPIYNAMGAKFGAVEHSGNGALAFLQLIELDRLELVALTPDKAATALALPGTDFLANTMVLSLEQGFVLDARLPGLMERIRRSDGDLARPLSLAEAAYLMVTLDDQTLAPLIPQIRTAAPDLRSKAYVAAAMAIPIAYDMALQQMLAQAPTGRSTGSDEADEMHRRFFTTFPELAVREERREFFRDGGSSAIFVGIIDLLDAAPELARGLPPLLLSDPSREPWLAFADSLARQPNRPIPRIEGHSHNGATVLAFLQLIRVGAIAITSGQTEDLDALQERVLPPVILLLEALEASGGSVFGYEIYDADLLLREGSAVLAVMRDHLSDSTENGDGPALLSEQLTNSAVAFLPHVPRLMESLGIPAPPSDSVDNLTAALASHVQGEPVVLPPSLLLEFSSHYVAMIPEDRIAARQLAADILALVFTFMQTPDMSGEIWHSRGMLARLTRVNDTMEEMLPLHVRKDLMQDGLVFALAYGVVVQATELAKTQPEVPTSFEDLIRGALNVELTAYGQDVVRRSPIMRFLRLIPSLDLEMPPFKNSLADTIFSTVQGGPVTPEEHAATTILELDGQFEAGSAEQGSQPPRIITDLKEQCEVLAPYAAAIDHRHLRFDKAEVPDPLALHTLLATSAPPSGFIYQFEVSIGPASVNLVLESSIWPSEANGSLRAGASLSRKNWEPRSTLFLEAMLHDPLSAHRAAAQLALHQAETFARTDDVEGFDASLAMLDLLAFGISPPMADGAPAPAWVKPRVILSEILVADGSEPGRLFWLAAEARLRGLHEQGRRLAILAYVLLLETEPAFILQVLKVAAESSDNGPLDLDLLWEKTFTVRTEDSPASTHAVWPTRDYAIALYWADAPLPELLLMFFLCAEIETPGERLRCAAGLDYSANPLDGDSIVQIAQAAVEDGDAPQSVVAAVEEASDDAVDLRGFSALDPARYSDWRNSRATYTLDGKPCEVLLRRIRAGDIVPRDSGCQTALFELDRHLRLIERDVRRPTARDYRYVLSLIATQSKLPHGLAADGPVAITTLVEQFLTLESEQSSAADYRLAAGALRSLAQSILRLWQAHAKVVPVSLDSAPIQRLFYQADLADIVALLIKIAHTGPDGGLAAEALDLAAQLSASPVREYLVRYGSDPYAINGAAAHEEAEQLAQELRARLLIELAAVD